MGDPRCLDRRASRSEQHRECLAFAGRARRAELRARERFACGPDCVERVGLRSIAALCPLGTVELDDELVFLREVAREARTVASGALDRPGAKAKVLVRERGEFLISVGVRLDGDFGEDSAGLRVDDCRAVRCDMGVDADHDVDDLGQTVHALLLSPEGRGRFRSGRRKAGL